MRVCVPSPRPIEHVSDSRPPHFLDLVLALGRYSCDSSSRPFCLLYQSNRVLRMDGRQYSARELMELISCGRNISKEQRVGNWLDRDSKRSLSSRVDRVCDRVKSGTAGS